MSDVNTNKTLLVAAPLSGWCAPLDDSPDAVFRDCILGDGASIDPTDNVVLAPFDAEVLTIPESRHAISLRAVNGAEFLIHVGIDTVELAGEGFTAHVQVGDRVSKGQRLLSFDLDGVMQHAPSLRTPVLLLRNDAYQMSALKHVGPIQAGDTLFEVTAVAATELAAEQPAHVSVNTHAKTVFVGLVHGIHARPAAMLVDSIRQLDAVVKCEAGSNKSANARSVVALMAMGVRHGAQLTVFASGVDAEQAVTDFVAVLEPLDASPAQDLNVLPDVEAVRSPVPGTVLRAQSAGAGLAIGPSFLLQAWQGASTASSKSPGEEQNLLADAIAAVREYLTELAASRTGTGRDIARAHLALLDDPTIADDARTRIREGASATVAWQRSIARISASLQQLDDQRLRERVDDLEDVNQRIQRSLAGYAPGETVDLPQDAIIIAHNLLPSQLLELDHARIAAICTSAGGMTSHVAILAASMDIPMLVAAGDAVLAIENDSLVAVDADYGDLYVQPDKEQAEEIRSRVQDDTQRKHREQAAAKEECRTRDGVRIHVNANVASASDAQNAVQQGADGCGLLRTEFIFMNRVDAPDFQEQLRIYQQISDALGDRPLVVRTLDAGGDKPIAYIETQAEENPALGVRGIRLSLRNQNLLEVQLDALLQVRRESALQIMIPMVTSVDELRKVDEIIDVLRQKRNMENEIQLGVMIETPAAAVIADRLAEIADFFSIGTNDLTQYTLAMDRGETALAAHFDTLHPAVLNLIAETVNAANGAGKPVAVCGGAAGDVLAAPILIGLGIIELSMVPGLVARQKARLRELDCGDCVALAQQALAMSSARDVRAMMREFMSGHAGG